MAMTIQEVRNRIDAARRLAEAEAARVPRAPVFPLVIVGLNTVEAAIAGGPRAAYEAGRSLGVLAVRELDDGSGDRPELCDAIMRVLDGLRQLSGLQYWE